MKVTLQLSKMVAIKLLQETQPCGQQTQSHMAKVSRSSKQWRISWTTSHLMYLLHRKKNGIYANISLFLSYSEVTAVTRIQFVSR